MKYIFLDIDGVLITPASMKKAFENATKSPLDITIAEEIDEGCIEVLREILDKNKDAQLVISSSRRGNMPRVLEIFEKYGIERDSIDKTAFPQVEPRDEEIYTYLKNKGDVTHLLIIDDENTIGYKWDATTGTLVKKESEVAHLVNYLVLTDTRYGLQPEDAEKAQEIIEKDYKLEGK